jgi:tetratricopeptide (TPR) repeat protein
MALGTGSIDQYTALFPFRSLSERSGDNLSSVWPDAADVLSYPPTSLRARRTIVGYLYASSSGDINTRLKDTGLETLPPADKLEGVEQAYVQLQADSDASIAARGISGQGALVLMRTLTQTPEQRVERERQVIFGLQQAINMSPTTWELTYNWGLANLLMGNYAATYEAMRGVRFSAQGEGNLWPFFWMGVAAVREGKPSIAISTFRDALAIQSAADATEGVKREYDQVHRLAREGLADAQWANRTPAEAYNSYLDLIKLGTSGTGVYNKWLRLGIEQHAYEALVRDMQDIYASGSLDSGLTARIHHDRARLLSFLGRQSEAIDEYRMAAGIAEGDPRLLISYAQALESAGEHKAALGQAELAITKLGKDPSVVDLTSIAATAVMTNANLEQVTTAQQLLDANLLRARAWGRTGQVSLVDSVAGQVQAASGSASAGEAGLLNLYGGFMYEAAGENVKARDSYHAAWDKLKGLPPGQPGRAAAVSGVARTDGALDGPNKGLETLSANSYNLASLKPNVGTDPDAPDVLTQGSLLQQQAGQSREAANTLRIAAIARNLQDGRGLNGVGRALWAPSSSSTPASGMLAVADEARKSGDTDLAKMRYRQAYGLEPALAPAFNNLGVLYAQTGNSGLAGFYLRASSAVSPGYVWGAQNLASYAYKQGLGNFVTGEQAQAGVIKTVGAPAAAWGYPVSADERGSVPTPYSATSDFLSKVPVLALLALLLAHTLVGRDTVANRGLIPTRGVLGRLGQMLDTRFKDAVPAVTAARPGPGGALVAIAIPALLGTLALAWHVGRGWIDVALVFLPVALVSAVIALAANELAQWVVARRNEGVTLHHTSLVGILLGLVSIPFGFMYGWGATTRVQPASAAADGKTGKATAARRSIHDSDLSYEAQVEAAADEGTLTEARGGGSSLGLSRAATIMLAGLTANLALGLVFGLAYLLTGWPSLRLALLANMLVLTFTAVSEPPADGWTLYRRNPALWLALFVFGAVVSVLLVAGVV